MPRSARGAYNAKMRLGVKAAKSSSIKFGGLVSKALKRTGFSMDNLKTNMQVLKGRLPINQLEVHPQRKATKTIRRIPQGKKLGRFSGRRVK